MASIFFLKNNKNNIIYFEKQQKTTHFPIDKSHNRSYNDNKQHGEEGCVALR